MAVAPTDEATGRLCCWNVKASPFPSTGRIGGDCKGWKWQEQLYRGACRAPVILRVKLAGKPATVMRGFL